MFQYATKVVQSRPYSEFSDLIDHALSELNESDFEFCNYIPTKYDEKGCIVEITMIFKREIKD